MIDKKIIEYERRKKELQNLDIDEYEYEEKIKKIAEELEL